MQEDETGGHVTHVEQTKMPIFWCKDLRRGDHLGDDNIV
jgi:hypothetical protein